MANLTGRGLLDQLMENSGVQLSTFIQNALVARLDAEIERDNTSSLAITAIVGNAAPAVREAYPSTGDMTNAVGEVIEEIAAQPETDPEPGDAPTFRLTEALAAQEAEELPAEYNIEDSAENILADLENELLLGAVSVTLTDESITEEQADALAALENFELGDVEVVGEVAPTPPENLTEALAALQAANAAKAEFLGENETTEEAIAADLEAAELALAQARATTTDNRLNANVSNAQNIVAAAEVDVDAVAGLTSAIATLEAAQVDLQAAEEARADALVDAQAELASFSVRNANTAFDGYEVTVDGELVIELDEEDGTLSITEAGAELEGIDALLAAHQALQSADQAEVAAQEVFADAKTAVNELDLTVGAVAAKEVLETAKEALAADVTASGTTEALQAELEAAQAALAESVADSEAVTSAQANVVAAQAAVDTRAELEGAVETAQTALDAHVAEFGETAVLNEAVTDAEAAVTARGVLETAVEEAQTAVSDRADLVQDVTDAQALVGERAALEATVTELTAAQTARPGLETAVTGAQTAVEQDTLWDTDVATTTQAHVDAVAAAQTNVDDFATESTTFTDAQGVVANLTTMAEGIQAVTWTAGETETEAAHDAFTAQAVTDGVITEAQKTAIDTAFADALTQETDLTAALAASKAAYESIVTDANTALTEASTALFVETAVPADLTGDLTTEIEAEGTARDTALTDATTAQTTFADLVTTLNEAETALQASISEFGSDAQLAADIAQAQLALDNFDTENPDVAGQLTTAEGLLTAAPSEAELQTALTNAQNALAVARADISDEALAQAVTDAEALVTQRTELEVALNGDGAEVVGAQGALDADVAANGTTEALETALAEAQALLDAAVSEGSPELVAEVADLEETLAERATLEANVETAQAAFDTAAATNPLYEELLDARGALETAEAAVEGRNELIDAVAEAQEQVDALEALNDDIDTAEAWFTDQDLALPVALSEDRAATADGDIFIFEESEGEGFSISGFGAEGQDTLYFGGDYTLVSLAELGEEGLEITDRVGDNDTLEIFWAQNEDNLELYVEADAAAGFDRGTLATAQMTQITLENFTDADITGFDGQNLLAGVAPVAEDTIIL